MGCAENAKYLPFFLRWPSALIGWMGFQLGFRVNRIMPRENVRQFGTFDRSLSRFTEPFIGKEVGCDPEKKMATGKSSYLSYFTQRSHYCPFVHAKMA
jgi:hypothetical protein